MTSQGDDSQRLYLERARHQILTEFRADLLPHWNIDLGKVHIPVRLGSTGLSWIYIGIDIVAFAFGVVGVFIGKSWRELGIALVVGSMFGFSTFVAQLLATQLSIEEHHLDLLGRDDRVRKYAVRLAQIDEEISRLTNQTQL